MSILAPPCPPEQWPRPHAAPICYERYHLQLDGPEACSAIVLGEPLWAANWPALRAQIDRRLGYAGSPDGLPRNVVPLDLGGAVIGLALRPDGSIGIVP